jgi:hypothetical protein
MCSDRYTDPWCVLLKTKQDIFLTFVGLQVVAAVAPLHVSGEFLEADPDVGPTLLALLQVRLLPVESADQSQSTSYVD